MLFLGFIFLPVAGPLARVPSYSQHKSRLAAAFASSANVSNADQFRKQGFGGDWTGGYV